MARLDETIARLKKEGQPRALDFRPNSPTLTTMHELVRKQILALPFGSLVSRQTLRALAETQAGTMRELLLWAATQEWSVKLTHHISVREKLWVAYRTKEYLK